MENELKKIDGVKTVERIVRIKNLNGMRRRIYKDSSKPQRIGALDNNWKAP